MLDMGEFKFIEETYDHRPRCDLSQKYLKIVGYSGHLQEQELVLYIINNATSLQKLILGVTCLESIWKASDIRLFRGNKNWLLASIMLYLIKINHCGLWDELASFVV